MKCQFTKEISEGSMLCDFMGVKPIEGISQCPTDIFNRCQEDANERAQDSRYLAVHPPKSMEEALSDIFNRCREESPEKDLESPYMR